MSEKRKDTIQGSGLNESANVFLSKLLQVESVVSQNDLYTLRRDFAKEQYIQYWEMLRQSTAFSWQIPTIVAAAALLTLGIDSNRLVDWIKIPIVPAVAFIILGLFIVVMWIHHRRNRLFVGYYEDALINLEENYGIDLQVYHKQISPRLKGLNRISSSSTLSLFLILLSVALLALGLYFLMFAL
jgi:hypothetical protein